MRELCEEPLVAMANFFIAQPVSFAYFHLNWIPWKKKCLESTQRNFIDDVTGRISKRQQNKSL